MGNSGRDAAIVIIYNIIIIFRNIRLFRRVIFVDLYTFTIIEILSSSIILLLWCIYQIPILYTQFVITYFPNLTEFG